ncbi:MAG TPA: 5'-3' exonuclease H3TH domain-containing protein, partial [Flavihumibacter sp.]
MDKRLFLLDAMALIFRAYYALIRSPRITTEGKNTNAQFGFTNALLELINNRQPSHMAVCFDTQAPTERHTDFTEYKANRQEAPEDLLLAIPDIKRIIRGFNIPVVELDGYEADDVVGTLSRQAAAAGYDVFMVTPDKDYGQLVTDKIKIYKPGYQGGDVEILGPEEVCAKWNIKSVDRVIDILGLMGDAVDNIPGIPGVGEKTAAKLLAEYGSLENILANAESIKGALGEKVRKGRDSAILSKKLATIITNVPVEFHEEDFRLKDWNKDALREIFTELEFKTLAKRVLGEEINTPGRAPVGVQTDLFGNPIATPNNGGGLVASSENSPETENSGQIVDKNIQNTPHDYQLVEGEDAIAALVKLLAEQPEICFDTETTNIDANNAELVGLSFSFKPHTGYYIPCPADQARTRTILNQINPLFQDPSKTWIGQNIKYDLLVLKWYGIELAGNLFDTMLAHYVIEPEGKRSMDQLSAKYLGYEPIPIEDLIGKKGKNQG